MPETFWHLSKCDLFSRLHPDQIRQMESVSRLKKFKRGETVYLPADDADGVMLVVSGRIKICHVTPEGKQSILVFVEPGEIFGELSLVDPTCRQEYSETTENSQLVLIPREEVQRCMRMHPDLTLGITKLIGLRRQRVERRLRHLLFHSNRERLVYLLLELIEQYGRRVDDGFELSIKLSHQEMANIIGSTRETVTVVLGELQKEGMIQIARRRVKIVDLDRLAAQVGAVPRLPDSVAAEPSHLHGISPVH
ncbi:MAG: Crp/Fnr family transcriptional regulator [Pirellulaceae bacterium]